jgi:hypothetical protein
MQTLLSLDSKKRLELNLTASFIDIVMTGAEIWGREGESVLHRKRGFAAPYVIKNFTGYSLKLWAELDDGSHGGEDHVIEDGKELPWRFEDWKSTREVRLHFFLPPLFSAKLIRLSEERFSFRSTYARAGSARRWMDVSGWYFSSQGRR